MSKLTKEDTDAIVNFVRKHKVLYEDPRDITKRSKRDELWEQLSRNINKDSELYYLDVRQQSDAVLDSKKL